MSGRFRTSSHKALKIEVANVRMEHAGHDECFVCKDVNSLRCVESLLVR